MVEYLNLRFRAALANETQNEPTGRVIEDMKAFRNRLKLKLPVAYTSGPRLERALELEFDEHMGML
jgi:hypothetical protein